METKESWNLISRYVVLLLFGLFNLALFYIIFTPLTIYPVVWILTLVDSGTTLLEGNLIFFRDVPELIEIIPACVAGAAYYLLLILNLTTPMNTKTRVKSISFLLLSFLVLNIVRILIFIAIAASGSQYFDVAHRFVWYFGSTVLVVLLWFLNVWIFKIKNIPIYTDIKNIFGDVFSGKKNRKTRRR